MTRLLTLLGVGLLALAFSAWYFGGLWYARSLARNVEALGHDRIERPSHLQNPLPGTFGEHLAHLDAELLALEHILTEDPGHAGRPCKGVVARWPEPLPDDCLTHLERWRPLMEGALQASHAEAAGVPGGLWMRWDPFDSGEGTSMALVHVARLAVVDMLRFLDAGENGEALTRCLDALAYARDFGHGSAVIGLALASSTLRQVTYGCHHVLGRLDTPGRARFVSAIQVIGQGMTSFRAAADADHAVMNIVWVRGLLPDRALPLLPGEIEPTEDGRNLFAQNVSGLIALLMTRTGIDGELEAARIEAEVKFERDWKRQQGRLDLLRFAAGALDSRARTGAWPDVASPWQVNDDRLECLVQSEDAELARREERWTFPAPPSSEITEPAVSPEP